MSFTVACQACGARFALPDDLYERKFKDRLVTVRCKHCGANISVDGIELASGPQHEIPVQDEGALPEQKAPVDMTPTVPLADASSAWTVSFDYEDDRELDRNQIAGALERGEIDAETIVWREGMEEWLPIAQVRALADLLQGKADATGGFLGTGMQLDADEGKLKKRAPPPHPSKRRSSPPRTGTPAAAKQPPPPRVKSLGELGSGRTAGKARALSAGTLFVEDKPAPGQPAPEPAKPAGPKLPTAPKAPVPAWKAKLADAPRVIDVEPPSSGTPALSDLTTALKPEPKKPERSDAGIFGVADDPGTLLAPPAFDLAPPTIDVESPAPPEPEIADDAMKFESEPAPAADLADAAPRSGGPNGRTIAGLALVGGAVAFSVWWFGFKAPRSASTQPPTASASAESTTPSAPAQAAAQNAPEPTESAAAAASSAPAPATTARALAAAEPHRAAHEPSAPAHEEKHATESAHTEAKTASEPSAPATAAATATASKGPFSRSAAIAALNSAAGAASSCRKQGDPSGMARVVITFAPSGRVTTARVTGPPFAGTPTGGCIASKMRGARVPAFSGPFVTVSKTVVIH